MFYPLPGDQSIIPPGTYAATQTSAATKNRGYRGAYFMLAITDNPGGVETLTFSVRVRDSITGEAQTITTFAAATAATNGNFVYLVYPGAVETIATAFLEVQGVPMPLNYEVVVTHSAAGDWDYSVSALYVP